MAALSKPAPDLHMHPAYLLLIFCFQLTGEAIHQLSGIPIPGAILGMLLLLASLCWIPPAESLKETAGTLARYLPLFFIPAGVGIVAYQQILFDNLLPIVATLLIATPAGVIASLVVFRRTLRKQPPEPTTRESND